MKRIHYLLFSIIIASIILINTKVLAEGDPTQSPCEEDTLLDHRLMPREGLGGIITGFRCESNWETYYCCTEDIFYPPDPD